MKLRKDKNKSVLKYLIMKLQNIKDKGKIVKAATEKLTDFLTVTWEARSQWNNNFNGLIENKHQPRSLYSKLKSSQEQWHNIKMCSNK